MLFTLHRYIFREVFKIFLLATVGLTLIVSLGSILGPIQEYGVGPKQVLHLMGYFIPVALTFVLPMAALFTTTLVYGRFAYDNEYDACRASGVSLPTLVYPGLVLAIIVAIANLMLSFHVVPAFVQRAEKSLKANAKQILFRNIQRKGYYKLPPDGRYRIYADLVDEKNNVLAGVIATEVKGNAIKKIITAQKAKVQFNAHDKFNEVRIITHNTYQMGSEDEGGFSAERLALTTEFGSLLGDEIKFKKIAEMKKIYANPMEFYPIEKLAHAAYAQLITELIAEDITTKLAKQADSNDVKFYELHSGTKLIKFNAEKCTVKDEKKIQLHGKVTLIESDPVTGQPLQTYTSTNGFLHIEGDEVTPTITLVIYNAVWQQPDGTNALTQRRVIRGLIPPTAVTDKFKINDILLAASPATTKTVLKKQPGAQLIMLQRRLKRKIQKTMLRIKAETHSRLAFGIGCVPMILIGIGLGIIKKQGHLLSAFAAGCLPATILVVAIISGKQITENPGSQTVLGIIIIWAGLAILIAIMMVLYRKLMKN